MGYQVTVTELIGWEHSLKNELILARHAGHREPAPPSGCALLAGVRPHALLERRFRLP